MENMDLTGISAVMANSNSWNEVSVAVFFSMILLGFVILVMKNQNIQNAKISEVVAKNTESSIELKNAINSLEKVNNQILRDIDKKTDIIINKIDKLRYTRRYDDQN